MDYPDGFSNEWRDYMTDMGIYTPIRKTHWSDEQEHTKELRLDFTSKKREGFTSTTDHAMRHEMQRMADKINELEKRINELEKPIEDYLK